MQAVHDKVMENSALLKELWEGRRQYKDLQLSLQRERDQAKAVQLEYAQFRHQVTLHTHMTALAHLTLALSPHAPLSCLKLRLKHSYSTFTMIFALDIQTRPATVTPPLCTARVRLSWPI